MGACMRECLWCPGSIHHAENLTIFFSNAKIMFGIVTVTFLLSLRSHDFRLGSFSGERGGCGLVREFCWRYGRNERNDLCFVNAACCCFDAFFSRALDALSPCVSATMLSSSILKFKLPVSRSFLLLLLAAFRANARTWNCGWMLASCSECIDVDAWWASVMSLVQYGSLLSVCQYNWFCNTYTLIHLSSLLRNIFGMKMFNRTSKTVNIFLENPGMEASRRRSLQPRREIVYSTPLFIDYYFFRRLLKSDNFSY